MPYLEDEPNGKGEKDSDAEHLDEVLPPAHLLLHFHNLHFLTDECLVPFLYLYAFGDNYTDREQGILVREGVADLTAFVEISHRCCHTSLKP